MKNQEIKGSFGHVQKRKKYPSVTLQKLKNHKFLFYLKMKPHMKIFLPKSVLSHVRDTLCNIFSQNLI